MFFLFFFIEVRTAIEALRIAKEVGGKKGKEAESQKCKMEGRFN